MGCRDEPTSGFQWWWELVVLCMGLTDWVGWGLQACSPAAWCRDEPTSGCQWWWELAVLCTQLTDWVGWGLQACSPAARSLFTYYLVSHSPLFFLDFPISCNVTTKEIEENSHDMHLWFWWQKPFSIAAWNIEHPLYPLQVPVKWESQFINSHPSCHCTMFQATKCTGVTRSCVQIPFWPWSP
jgi:hypothetical protein